MPTNNMFLSGPMSGNNVWNTQPLSAPTKQQKFPGLSDEQIKRLESVTSDPQRQQELYKQAIQQLNQNNVKENRIAAENEMTYRNLNEKDTRQKNFTDSRVRLEQLADLAKTKYGLRQDADTQSVINGVIGMAQDQGVSLDAMNNYLDTGDETFLFDMGLKVNAKEKLRDDFWGSVWDNIKTQAAVPIDSMKKRGKRTFNEASEKIYKTLLKKTLGDSVIGEMGINLDDYVDTVTDKTVQPALRQETLDYQNKINQKQAERQQKNLDQDIANYYNNKGYTKLLKEGDFKGFLYKSMGDAAQNWEMPVVIAASVFQPEIGLTLMATDSYARENQEAFEAMTNNGATYEQAEEGAVVVGLVNAAVEVTLDRLLGGVETATSNTIRKTLTKNVQEEAVKKGLGKILLEGAGNQLKSSAEEGLEEVVQQIVQNAAVKTVNENQKLFEGIGSAFEGGFYNPMNLLAGGSNINQNLQANKSEVRQSIMDNAYNAKTYADNLWNSVTNKTKGMSEGITNAENKLSKAINETYGIDETLKKNIQDNPYSADVWERTKEWINKNGRPEKANEVSSALIDDVVERVQKSLTDKMEEGSETGKLYKPLLDAGYSVDLSELKEGIDEMLEKYGVKIEKKELDNGKTKTILNFDKTAIDGSEASNIIKIYNWIKNTNKPMSLEEYKNRFRKTMSDMVNFNQVGRDQAGRKAADTPGDVVIKGIRSFANDLAHNQIPELAALDKQFNEWVEIMDEVSDGLVYKEAKKRGVIRDNITQIISNLDNKNRRQIANRLEKIMPGITEEVRAINNMPQLVKHYYNPSKQQQTITTAAGGLVGSAIGSFVGLPAVGAVVGAGAGYWLSGKIDKLKSAKWNKIISETSEDGMAKLNDIQERIEDNKKISKEQKAFLEKISQKLKEGKADKEAEIAKIIADVSTAENELYAIDKAISDLEILGAKEEMKELKEIREGIIKQKQEEYEMQKAKEEFEGEKENIINESADQRLPEFKERIYKLQEEEKRIGSVAGKKIGKTFEGKDYKNQQETEWLRKKDKLIEEIGEFYNVDQQEASEIYDRIERTVSMDDLGFNRKPASSKTAKYGAEEENITPQIDDERLNKDPVDIDLDMMHERWKAETQQSINNLRETIDKWEKAKEKANGDMNQWNIFDDDNLEQAKKQLKDLQDTWDFYEKDQKYQRYGTANPNERGISATEGLNIRNFKNGKTVQELANQYGIDTKIVDSISTPEGQRAYGMYGDRLITLSKDLKESTVPHELLHGVFDMVDSKRRTSILEGIQKKLNIDNVQAEEWLADNFSEYYRTGKFGTQGLAKTFVEKIKQFFYQIKSYIDGTYKNEKQIRQLFNDIIDGKIEGEYGVYSDPKFQSVWHGSPYSFEKFDSAHMGEGEGAQAHGWGHYVAANEDTSRYYAEMGRRKQGKTSLYKGKTWNERLASGDPDRTAILELWDQKGNKSVEEFKKWWMGDYKEAKDYFKMRIEVAQENLIEDKKYFGGGNVDKYEKEIDNLQVKLNTLEKQKEVLKKMNESDFEDRYAESNLYEVEIPDSVKKDTPTGSNYLDEEGKITKSELEKVYEALIDEFEKKKEGKSKWVNNLQDDQLKQFRDRIDTDHMKNGEDLYAGLSRVLGGDKKASKFLESLGYDGIHYFGGRDGEAYVIFNDKALDITKHHKY